MTDSIDRGMLVVSDHHSVSPEVLRRVRRLLLGAGLAHISALQIMERLDSTESTNCTESTMFGLFNIQDIDIPDLVMWRKKEALPCPIGPREPHCAAQPAWRPEPPEP